MSAILHYQYSITHFAAKAKHFYREPAAKGRLPHRLLQTAGTGPAGPPPAGADLSVLTWGRYFLGNMLPVTLGNTAGGVLVGLAAWYCYLRKKG